MDSNEKLISKVYDNIVIPETDKRKYRGLELSNGLKVILISDPDTDKSAASLQIQIGYMSDPRNLPGLAHFCEHMVFLGTKKYPVENEYNKFLQEHNGYSNAFTGADSTCFYFDIATDTFKEGLDRFAQFFLNPLFSVSATEREVKAVHSEHEKNFSIDSWRIEGVEKATCNPKHDYSKFGTGNFETLWTLPKSKGINIREELLKFHDKFYSSNLMNLTVYGNGSLEELTKLVVPLFSKVVNKKLDVPSWANHPCDARHKKVIGHIVPIKEIRELNTIFPIPYQEGYFQTDPVGYLSNLIGHEGPGSLLSELKRLGWGNHVKVGLGSSHKYFAFFIINIQMTKEGLEHVVEIVCLVFQYLKLIKQTGVQEWIYDELKNIGAMNFRFSDKFYPSTYTTYVAARMAVYPIEDVLSATYVLGDFKADVIHQLLDQLKPDNVRVGVIAKEVRQKCIETERWYGTKYKLDTIKGDILKKYKEVELHSNLHLPSPNEFLPDNFEIVPKDEISPVPVLLKNTKMGQMWFKQDDKFALPKALMTIEFESPMASVDPLHYNMNNLYLLLVKDVLNEYAYSAQLAGLNYCTTVTNSGFNLQIAGYNQKMPVLLEKIMEKLINMEIDEDKFKIWKAELLRLLKNFKANAPHTHALYFTTTLLNENVWMNDELMSCSDDVTLKSMQLFVPSLFSKVHYVSLIYGNMNKKQACDLIEVVESALNKVGSKHMIPSQFQGNREYQLNDGSHYVYERKNEVHNSSAVESYYQCGVQSSRMNVMVELLASLIREPCFTYLRTQEQLGYIVSSFCKRSAHAIGLAIVVQSDKSPSFVDNKIEVFLQWFEKYLQDLPQEEYKKHVDSLAACRLEKPKTMKMVCSKYWIEIAAKHYNFDRDAIEVNCLKNISKEDLYFFFKEMIACDAPKRKKLSVHIVSSNGVNAGDEVEGQYPYIPEQAASFDGFIPPPPAFRPPVKIEGIPSFKESLGLYPLAAPWIQIPSPFAAVSEKAKL